MNQLKQQINSKNLYSEYVKILNGVLQLSNREAEVFSFLLEEDSVSKSKNINTKDIRKRIIEKYNISEANLSRYLRVIKDKGLIVKDNFGKWVINDLIRPNIVEGYKHDADKRLLIKYVNVSFFLELC